MASSDANLKTLRDLTAKEAQLIFSHSNELLCKELLAEKLGIPPFQDKNDPQKPLFISYIFDNIKFAVDKGVPWEHIPLVIRFAHELLKQILVANHSLKDVILDINSLFYLLDSLNDHHKKLYLDFLLETVLKHYNLYKYVFTTPRMKNVIKINREVVIPPKPLPLVYGKEKVVFEYEEKIKNIEKLETQAHTKLKDTFFRNQPLAPHKTVNDLDDVPLPYEKMSLEQLIKDIVSGVMEKKEKELIFHTDQVFQDLSFKFEKIIIPRPQVMGSPPRFEMKHELKTTVSNTAKSKTSESKSMVLSTSSSRK